MTAPNVITVGQYDECVGNLQLLAAARRSHNANATCHKANYGKT